jgi:hypothetical protein
MQFGVDITASVEVVNRTIMPDEIYSIQMLVSRGDVSADGHTVRAD